MKRQKPSKKKKKIKPAYINVLNVSAKVTMNNNLLMLPN